MFTPSNPPVSAPGAACARAAARQRSIDGVEPPHRARPRVMGEHPRPPRCGEPAAFGRIARARAARPERIRRASVRPGNAPTRAHRRRRPRRALVTTGTPAAIASRILFWVPRAMLSGATISAERWRCGRTSGTEPVTVTPGSSPSLRTAGDGSAPTIRSLDLRPTRADERQRPRAEVEHALLVRVVVHAPDEADRVGIVGLGRGREVLAVDAVREPVGRDAGVVALERLPLGAGRRGAQVEAPREALLLALELAALEPVAGDSGNGL